jgi:hypothetical protein
LFKTLVDAKFKDYEKKPVKKIILCSPTDHGIDYLINELLDFNKKSR